VQRYQSLLLRRGRNARRVERGDRSGGRFEIHRSCRQALRVQLDHGGAGEASSIDRAAGIRVIGSAER
jgi:hypothetical protein